MPIPIQAQASGTCRKTSQLDRDGISRSGPYGERHQRGGAGDAEGEDQQQRGRCVLKAPIANGRARSARPVAASQRRRNVDRLLEQHRLPATACPTARCRSGWCTGSPAKRACSSAPGSCRSTTAIARGHAAAQPKIPLPGRMTTSAPAKPPHTSAQRSREMRSFRNERGEQGGDRPASACRAR